MAGEDAQKCVYSGQGMSLALPVKGALGSCLVPRTLCGDRCSCTRKPQWRSHCILSLCLPRYCHQLALVFRAAPHHVSGACAILIAVPAGACEQPQTPCFFLSPLRGGLARGKWWCNEGDKYNLLWRRGDRPSESLRCSQLWCHCSRYAWHRGMKINS